MNDLHPRLAPQNNFFSYWILQVSREARGALSTQIAVCPAESDGFHNTEIPKINWTCLCPNLHGQPFNHDRLDVAHTPHLQVNTNFPITYYSHYQKLKWIIPCIMCTFRSKPDTLNALNTTPSTGIATPINEDNIHLQICHGHTAMLTPPTPTTFHVPYTVRDLKPAVSLPHHFPHAALLILHRQLSVS